MSVPSWLRLEGAPSRLPSGMRWRARIAAKHREQGISISAFSRLKSIAFIAGRAGCVFAQPALAQTYPSQPINVIVAFAAGGIADALGRLVGQKLNERVQQSVVIENRGGAGGNLAARAVATAAPDGYTLLATTTALAVNDTASKKRGYNTSDLRAVAIVAISPDVLAVHP